MNKKLIFIVLLSLAATVAHSKSDNDCKSLMLNFLEKTQKNQNKDLKKHSNEFLSLGFTEQDSKIIIEALNLRDKELSKERVKEYLSYVLTLKEKDQKIALMDLEQLDTREINSPYVLKFNKHEEKLKAKFKSKNLVSATEQNRYRELYYGCKALRPNEINKGAARDFKRFNYILSLGTLGASYAFYNMDKDINAEWFEKLGYDIGTSLLFSYIGGTIQTNPNDTQMVKTLKNYLIGRVIGVTDVLVYDPIFNKEREIAEKRIEELKKDPEHQKEIDELLKSYNERGVYRKFKDEIISSLKKLPSGISLGVKGNSIDENNVDWNNLSKSDLDRPEVQEVLVLAAMNQVYEKSKGEWIQTSDSGVDRYVFNTVFYGVQMPRSMLQTYITYQTLCMGQDSPKISFAKAVLLNVASNFIVNQALYDYRKKAIGN